MSEITIDQVIRATPEETARLAREAKARKYEDLVQDRAEFYRADAEAKRRARGPRGSIELLSESQFDLLPASKFVVPGLILEASLGTVVGPPGSLKTFTALDLGLSIASEQEKWLGLPLHAKGTVIYIVAEGQGRFKYRKAVWKQVRGVTGVLPFYVVIRPVDLRDPDQMADLLRQILPLKPVAVFVDTLNRCLPGAEENSAKELGEAIAACSVIQQDTGAFVQLLHHPTKTGETARGSGAGLGAVESELWLDKTASAYLFELRVGKEKEAEDQLVIPIKKRVVELDGVFEHGEPVTSCVIERADQADVARAAASLERQILELIQKNPGLNVTEAKKRLGKNAANVGSTIQTLIYQGRLAVVTKGKSKLLQFVSFTIQTANLGLSGHAPVRGTP